MKNKIVICGVLLVLALIFWLVWPKQQTQKSFQAKETNAIITSIPTQQISKTVDPLWTNTDRLPTPEELQKLKPELERRRKALAEMADNEWRAPIEFYGIVEDESNDVVAGADVHFIWTDLSLTGNSEQSTISDNNGLFSLRNTTGKNLIVIVSKSGYYEYAPSGLAFNYAGENKNFVPDANNPTVFRLRKKGDGANLIHLHTSFRIPKDGTPVLIDLATGKITTSVENAIQIECWTRDVEKKEGWKFDWKCRVSVPNSGLQTYDEVFPFLAPEGNYVSEDIIDETVTPNIPWTNDVKHNYYIRTASGNYGRMSFRMVAHGDHFCQIDSYFDPSGSRNLEQK